MTQNQPEEGDEGALRLAGREDGEGNSPQELYRRSCGGILIITREGILGENEVDELRDLGV